MYSVEGLKSRLRMTEEAICKSENMSIAITQSEGKRIKS